MDPCPVCYRKIIRDKKCSHCDCVATNDVHCFT
jgi:hypothetical protein